MQQIRRRIGWIVNNNFIMSVITCTIFFLVVVWYYPIRFDTNDDPALMYYFAGYYTGGPQPYYAANTVLLGSVVSTLYKLFPMLPCYTLLMLTVMYIATVAIIYTLMKAGAECKLPLILRELISLAFLVLYVLRSTVYLQFTTTAGFAAGAAIILALSFSPKNIKYNILYGAIIVLLLYISLMYRVTVAQPAILFIGCILAYKILYYGRHHIKTFSFTFLAIVTVYAIGIGIHQISIISNQEWKDFSEFKKQRVQITDYPIPSYEDAPEIYNAVGWGQEEVSLFRSFCFIIPGFNIDNLSNLNNEIQAYNLDVPVKVKIHDMLSMLKTLWGYKYIKITYLSLIIIWFIYALFALRNNGSKYTVVKEPCQWAEKITNLKILRNHELILVLGLFILFHSFALYLAYTQRFPLRVYRMLVLMFAPVSLYLLISKLKWEESRNMLTEQGKFLGISINSFFFYTSLTICSMCCFFVSDLDAGQIYKSQSQTVTSRRAIEEFAMQHPENLYVYTHSASGIAHPLTVYPDKKPTNVIGWGGTSAFSPLWYKQLEKNGLDELTLDSFTQDNVYFVSHSISENLIEYFRKHHPSYYFVEHDRLASGAYIYKLTYLTRYDTKKQLFTSQ